MSTSLLLPNPCLLGIVFCISTHDGNQLVFHYPPNPNEFGFKPTPLDNQVMDDEDSFSTSSSESESSDIDRLDSISDMDSMGRTSRGSFSTDFQSGSFGTGSNRGNSFDGKYSTGRDILEMMDERDRRRKRKASRRLLKLNTNLSDTSKDLNSPSMISSATSNGGNSLKSTPQVDPLNSVKEYRIEKLFTFDIDFISDLATPPKALCNNRFELTVEDMVFLGLPIRVNDDGKWRPTKQKTNTKKSASTRNRSSSRRESVLSDLKSRSHNMTDEDEEEVDGTRHESDIAEEETKSNVTDGGMYQFNLLFVLNPPVVEYNYRVDEIFYYIVSRLSLLLRYEQQNSNYIWEESQKIMKMKEDLIHLPINTQWEQIIENTSLGKLIAQTYESISKSEILNVEVNGRIRSFQIPIKNIFSSLPPRTSEIPEGSTLSSLSPFNQLSSIESISHLDINDDTMCYFALILLDDVESIINDIRVDTDSVFASFIRMIKPSESLMKLSALSGLGIQEVKLFANHLVYWRRAKAVLPISSKNVYVVSPMAPMKRVYEDSIKFNRNFPNLPQLTTFLSLISDLSNTKPKPISVLIPSKDHKELYLEAISWSLKNGYLIQLCSFFYLKITKKVKIEVSEEIEMEVKKRQEKNARKEEHLSENDFHSGDDNDSINSDDSHGNYLSDNNLSNLIKKSSTATSNDANITDNVGTVAVGGSGAGGGTENTHSGKDLNTDNTADVDQTVSKSLSESINSESTTTGYIEFEEEDDEDSILAEPEYATALERRWISKIVANKPPEVVSLFYKILKHLNGKKALEILLTQEGISRTEFRKLLEALEDNLVVVRHW